MSRHYQKSIRTLTELFEFHALISLHIRIVYAGIQKNDGIGEDIDGLVGAVEERVALELIALDVAEGEHVYQVLDLLRLAGHAEVGLEFAQGLVDGQSAQVDELNEVGEDLEDELVLRVADVVADHLLAQAVAVEEEVGDAFGAALKELLLDEVANALLGLAVEQIQADEVFALADVELWLQHLVILAIGNQVAALLLHLK